MRKKLSTISFFMIISVSVYAQDLCPANGIEVFGGDMQNIVSWGEPVGDIACGDFAINDFPFSHQYSNAGMGDDWLVQGSQGEDVAYTLNVGTATTFDVTMCNAGTAYDS